MPLCPILPPDPPRARFLEESSKTSLQNAPQSLFISAEGEHPLLDGHEEQQMRVANPTLQWLRDVAIVVIKTGRAGDDLTATDIADICEDESLPLPGRPGSKDEPKYQIGRAMSKIFADMDQITVDSAMVSKHSSTVYDEKSRPFTRHSYKFSGCSD